MSKENLASIVVPVYKSDMNPEEKVSWERCKQVFAGEKILVIYPEGLDLKNYEGASEYIAFDKKYFQSTRTYNILLCSSFFYKKFLDYSFILIYQLDAYVFENRLQEWCQKDYSYIGAPWIDASWIKNMNKKLFFFEKLINPVGNGGFSLRKVKQHYRLSHLFPFVRIFLRPKWNEDLFWTSIINRLIPAYKVPGVAIALDFAFEENPEKCFKLNNNKLPFGCHAWEKFDTEFWLEKFKSSQTLQS